MLNSVFSSIDIVYRSIFHNVPSWQCRSLCSALCSRVLNSVFSCLIVCIVGGQTDVQVDGHMAR